MNTFGPTHKYQAAGRDDAPMVSTLGGQPVYRQQQQIRQGYKEDECEPFGEFQEVPQTFQDEMLNYNPQYAPAPPYEAQAGPMGNFEQLENHQHIFHHHHQQPAHLFGAEHGQAMGQSNFYLQGVTSQGTQQQHLAYYDPALDAACNERPRPMRVHAPQLMQHSYCQPVTMASDRHRQHEQPQYYHHHGGGFADQQAFNGFSAGNFSAPQQVIGDHAQYQRQDMSILDEGGVQRQNNLLPTTTTTNLQQRVHYGHEQQTHSLSNDSHVVNNNTPALCPMLSPRPPPVAAVESNLTARGSMQALYLEQTPSESCGFFSTNNANLIAPAASSSCDLATGELDSEPQEADSKEQVVYGNETELRRANDAILTGREQEFTFAPVDEVLNEPINCQPEQADDTRTSDLRPLSSISQRPRQTTSVADQQDYIDMRPSGDLSQEWLDTICRHMIEHMDSFGICVIDNFLGSIKGEMILSEVRQLFSNRSSSYGRLVSDRLEPSANSRQAPLDPAKNIRNDRVIWVDGCEEGCEEINNLIQTLCSVVTNSSRLSLYSNNGLDKVVITKRTKAHVACYPGNGTRYIKHVDNPNGDGRVITAIYYLNKSWDTTRDGGLLRMFPAGVEKVANIEPLFDRVIFFWSDRRNPHEVLPAFRDRFAITVWYIGDNRSQET